MSGGEENMFEKELEYYKANKEELLRHHENHYVVIAGDRFLGAYTTDQEAYEAGLEELGNVPFLIKRVTRDEEVVRFPALAVGVINANT